MIRIGAVSYTHLDVYKRQVSGTNVTCRTAVATGEIHVGEAIMEAVKEGSVKKGDVLGVARVAGIMGVKRTSELIPMCHPLPIQKMCIRDSYRAA